MQKREGEANTLAQFSESKDLRGGLLSSVSFLFLCIEPNNTRIERKRLKASTHMTKVFAHMRLAELN
jgi:hypothetical protein